MAAPSSSAIARLNPRPATPSKVVAAMVRGMATASNRHVGAQPFRLMGRSSFSPAPIREMMTTSSVSRSVRVSQVRGSGLNDSMSRLKIANPRPRQIIASDSGSRRRPLGAHETSSTTAPRPSRNRM